MNTISRSTRKCVLLYVTLSLIFSLLLAAMSILGMYANRAKKDSDTAVAAPPPPIVIIDAGHGGEDGGTIGVNGAYEKDINLKISLILYDMLRSNGIDAVLTRDRDILLYDKNSNYQGQKKIQDLATRRKIAESYENAIFVSIHMNSFVESKYSGLQVYYSKNDPSSQALADKIQTRVRTHLDFGNDRKCKSAGENIYLLYKLQCPAVLIECGFLSNPEECEKLSTESYQKQLSFCICAAILEHINRGQNHYNGT